MKSLEEIYFVYSIFSLRPVILQIEKVVLPDSSSNFRIFEYSPILDINTKVSSTLNVLN